MAGLGNIDLMNQIAAQLNIAEEGVDRLEDQSTRFPEISKDTERTVISAKQVMDEVLSNIDDEKTAQINLNQTQENVVMATLEDEFNQSEKLRVMNKELLATREMHKKRRDKFSKASDVAYNASIGLDEEGNPLPFSTKLLNLIKGKNFAHDSAAFANRANQHNIVVNQSIAARAGIHSNAIAAAAATTDSENKAKVQNARAFTIVQNIEDIKTLDNEKLAILAARLSLEPKRAEALIKEMGANINVINASLSTGGVMISLAQLDQASASATALKQQAEYLEVVEDRLKVWNEVNPGKAKDVKVSANAIVNGNRQLMQDTFGANFEEIIFFIGANITSSADLQGLSTNERLAVEPADSQFARETNKAASIYMKEKGIDIQARQFVEAGVTDSLSFSNLDEDVQKKAIDDTQAKLIAEMDDSIAELGLPLALGENSILVDEQAFIDAGLSEEAAKNAATMMSSDLREGNATTVSSFRRDIESTMANLAISVRDKKLTLDQLAPILQSMPTILASQQRKSLTGRYSNFLQSTAYIDFPMNVQFEFGGFIDGTSFETFDLTKPIEINRLFMRFSADRVKDIDRFKAL